MQKLPTQFISASTLLLCPACVDTEPVYERLADSRVGEIDWHGLFIKKNRSKNNA